jgi:hypothetical protein
MSVVSLPVTRPAGRVLIIANPALQPQPLALMEQLGFECHVAPDPYSAMAEISSPTNTYRGIVISLQSFYREEITLISAIKRRYPNVEIWLTQTDGRQAALAEAMRLGSDGLLADDGLHRIASPQNVPDILPISQPPPQPIPLTQNESEHAPETNHLIPDDSSVGEPVLTADELRALLQEQPSMPPAAGSDN